MSTTQDNTRNAAMFASEQDTLNALRNVGYITNAETAGTVFLAARLHKPILLEGPAGAGKTEMAVAVHKASGLPLIRLQCYTGITKDDAFGTFNAALQDFYVKSEGGQRGWQQVKKEIVSRDFFVPGPLLEACECEHGCVLLIDEIDKIPVAFEAMLLEFLSAWQLSIPGLGTVPARTVPFVVLTSNAERPIGYPIRRRSLFLLVEHPTAEAEATIVARKTPNCSPKTHLFIAGLASALRKYDGLEKPPSISEMNDIAAALELLGKTEISESDKATLLPLIAKTDADRGTLLMSGCFETIVRQAKADAEAIQKARAKGADSVQHDAAHHEQKNEAAMAANA